MKSIAIIKGEIKIPLFMDTFNCLWGPRLETEELILDPNDDIRGVYFHDNLLTELKLTNTVIEAWCHRNLLTSLEVPDTLTHLTCDKELFDYDTCRIPNVEIIY